VLTQPGSDKILGATIVGAHAGEILIEFVTAMKFGIGLGKILQTIHSYPTFAEANKFAAGVWRKERAPEGLLRILGKIHSARR
jgi:pyruvate/2-oxoglutarate dehydrogenase complex dihydrolipoamide dehydrogenase (E3) component